MTDQSVTTWINELKSGESAAAEKLWHRYFNQLVLVGKRALGESPRRAADEEDVALSAFKSFCLRAAQGQFEQLDDRGDLWKLLTTITIRKARKQACRENLRKTLDDSTFLLDGLASSDPPPEFVVLLDDTTESSLAKLGDPMLQQVARGRLEGLTHREIAARISRSIPTVERKLRLVREIWSAESML